MHDLETYLETGETAKSKRLSTFWQQKGILFFVLKISNSTSNSFFILKKREKLYTQTYVKIKFLFLFSLLLKDDDQDLTKAAFHEFLKQLTPASTRDA